jgi:threonine dehydratase
MIDLGDVQAAARRVGSHVRRTPLVRSETLSAAFDANVYLKLEVFQKTGAFKVRGAFNKMLTLSEEQRRGGVVAVSAGNHAQAVAYAARALGLRALVLMPTTTPENYVEATQGYGAEVMLADSLEDAFVRAREFESRGMVYVHPYDDPLVMAGQGTIGLEILEDLPQATDVFVSIGGGGLMAGVATAVKSLKPTARVWGCETAGADSMARALSAGHVVRLPEITSVARTLGAPSVAQEAFVLARRHLEEVTVVRDDEALDALRFLLERAKVLTEPASSCTLAAARRLRARFDRDSHIVLVLCGGNIALEHLVGRAAA